MLMMLLCDSPHQELEELLPFLHPEYKMFLMIELLGECERERKMSPKKKREKKKISDKKCLMY